MKKHNKYGAETRQEYKMLYMREWRQKHQQQSRDSAKRRYEARKARKAAEAEPNRKGLGKKKQPQQAETEQNGFSYINTFGFQIGSNLAGQQAKTNVKQQDNEQEGK